MDALMRIGYVLDDMTDELTQAALLDHWKRLQRRIFQ